MTVAQPRARALGVLVVALVLIVSNARGAWAQTLECTRGATTPVVVLDHTVRAEGLWDGATEADRAATEAQARVRFTELARVFLERLRERAEGVEFVSTEEFQNHLNNIAQQQLNGRDFEGLLEETQLGSEFRFTLAFTQRRAQAPPPRRTVRGALINTRTNRQVRSFVEPLSDTPDEAEGQIGSRAMQEAMQLYCDLSRGRLVPVAPRLTVTVTPHEPTVGSEVNARVTLIDADDSTPQPSLPVTVVNAPPSGLPTPDVPITTDAHGEVSGPFEVGNVPGRGNVTANFRREDGLTAPPVTATYNVVDPNRDLTMSAPRAALRVGDGETVCARLRRNGAPAAGAVIDFAATGGGAIGAPTAITDQEGQACTEYQTPAQNATVDVTARTTVAAPQAAAVELRASLTFVVDGGVSLAVSAANTVEGATTSVIADLTVGGAGQAGIPVTFNLAGPGLLSATAAQTDGAGRAEVTYFASEANTNVTVTAEAVVDGQTYTRTATINVGAAPPPDEPMPLTVRFAEVRICFLETGAFGPGFLLPPSCANTSGPLPLQLSADDSSVPYRNGPVSTVTVSVTSSGVDVNASVRPQTCCGPVYTIALIGFGFEFEGGRGGTLTASTNTGWLGPLPPNPTQRPGVTLQGYVASDAGSPQLDFDFVTPGAVGTPVASVQITSTPEDEEEGNVPHAGAGFELRIVNTFGFDETGTYSDPVSGGGRVLTIGFTP